MGKTFRLFGAMFFLLGVAILLNSFHGMTGFVVYGGGDIEKGYLVGVWYVITGLVLVAYRRKD